MGSEREEIINYIKSNGPVLPVNIAKMFRTDIMLASAMLSELVSAKHLKLTKLTIGGSPVYYVLGQEDKLEEKLYHVLKGPEKEVYQMLKERKVVLESELTPVVRVGLRSLKDFSIHITVREGEYEFDFWKFYLVPDDVAQEMIRMKINDLMKAEINVVHEKKSEPVHVPVENEIIKSQSEHIRHVLKDEHEVEVKTQTIEDVEIEHKVTPDLIEKITERLINELKPKLKKDKKKREINHDKEQSKLEIKNKIDPEKEKVVFPEGKFYEKLCDFCKVNKIDIKNVVVVKKDKEFDLLVEVPSNLGVLKYYMKAKDKDKVSEHDVAIAYSDGQLKKLPVILVSNGVMTKKAEGYISKFQGYIVFRSL